MKYQINKDLLIEEVDKETMIYDSDRSIFYSFNDSARFIIKDIKSGKAIEEIVTRLTKKYGIEKTKAKNDLDEFLRLLLNKKIILPSKK